MTPEIQEVLPIAVGLAAGTGIGAYLEARAYGKIQTQEQALSGEWGDSFEPQQKKRVGRFVGSLMVAGALVGALNGGFWQPEASVQSIPPQIEIVVDHSGATALGNGAPAHEISEIITDFEHNDGIEATAFVARADEVKHVELDKVNEVIPFGNAPLDRATKNALDQAGLNQSARDKKHENDGVLILTNGNKVGLVSSIVGQSNANKTPVFVVNVESGKSNPQTIIELKTIASKTSGHYWEADKKNIKDVSKVANSTLSPESVPVKNSHPNRWPMRGIMLVASITGITYFYKKRHLMTLGRRLSKGVSDE